MTGEGTRGASSAWRRELMIGPSLRDSRFAWSPMLLKVDAGRVCRAIRDVENQHNWIGRFPSRGPELCNYFEDALRHPRAPRVGVIMVRIRTHAKLGFGVWATIHRCIFFLKPLPQPVISSGMVARDLACLAARHAIAYGVRVRKPQPRHSHGGALQ